MLTVTGIIIGLFAATGEVIVIESWCDPTANPAAFTLASTWAGDTPEEFEKLIHGGAAAMVKGTAVALPAKLMYWPGGFDPTCPVKVKLDGLSANLGLSETTSVTGMVSDAVAAALETEIAP